MSYLFGKNCLKFSSIAIFLLFFQLAKGQSDWSDVDNFLQTHQKEMGKDFVMMVWKKDDTVVYKKEIGALKALKTLQVADCSLFDDSIPEELTTLPLEEITLTSNGLTNFELLTKIASLKKINLGGNDIVEIPTSVVTNNEIKNLKNLELLNLSKNNISDISQVLDALSDIKLLVIISNKNLTHNPVDEGQLEKLAKKTALVASVS